MDNRWIIYDILVGGWATPLKNMKVHWDDDSQYMEKSKMFQTTNQSFSKVWGGRILRVSFFSGGARYSASWILIFPIKVAICLQVCITCSDMEMGQNLWNELPCFGERKVPAIAPVLGHHLHPPARRHQPRQVHLSIPREEPQVVEKIYHSKLISISLRGCLMRSVYHRLQSFPKLILSL